METKTRLPAVAGRFYPGDDKSLRLSIKELCQAAPATKKSVLAAVSPHAGYVYSGGVAGETIGQIDVPESVVLLGPNHTGKGQPVALSTTSWQMPMGTVPVDLDLAQKLLNKTAYIQKDELAHRYEHSLEVQLPFLQLQQPKLSIVPIAISHISYQALEEIGQVLASVIQKSGKEVLLLASSDMTHYEPRSVAEKKDHYVLKKITDMDPATLYRSVTSHRISMCGIMPVTVALIAALTLGATKTELVRYTDSGEITGDTEQVVGYAGLLIS